MNIITKDKGVSEALKKLEKIVDEMVVLMSCEDDREEFIKLKNDCSEQSIGCYVKDQVKYFKGQTRIALQDKKKAEQDLKYHRTALKYHRNILKGLTEVRNELNSCQQC